MTDWLTLDEAVAAELTTDEWDVWRGEIAAITELGLSSKRKIPPSRRITLARDALRRAKTANNEPLVEKLSATMKILRRGEAALKRKLLAGTLKAKGVPEGKHDAKLISNGLWQKLKIDFYKGDAGEDRRVLYSGLLIFDPKTEKVLGEKRGRGQPNSRKLYMAELLRRARSKQLANGVKAQAYELSEWLKQNHPSSPPAKPLTIENAIRATFNSLINKNKKP